MSGNELPGRNYPPPIHNRPAKEPPPANHEFQAPPPSDNYMLCHCHRAIFLVVADEKGETWLHWDPRFDEGPRAHEANPR